MRPSYGRAPRSPGASCPSLAHLLPSAAPTGPFDLCRVRKPPRALVARSPPDDLPRVGRRRRRPPLTLAIWPGSVVTLEGLLHCGDYLGLIVRDRHELGERAERHVAHGDHDGELPAALALDVARQAVTEQDRLSR